MKFAYADQLAIGLAEAPEPDACPRCHGEGEVGFNDSRNPRDHQHDQWARCPDCHGTGELTDDDDA